MLLGKIHHDLINFCMMHMNCNKGLDPGSLERAPFFKTHSGQFSQDAPNNLLVSLKFSHSVLKVALFESLGYSFGPDHLDTEQGNL
jgi:hypothetical protein